MTDGDRPLSVRPHREAWHAEDSRFFLHSAGVGEDCDRATDKADELDVANWLLDMDVSVRTKSRLFEDRTSTGCNRPGVYVFGDFMEYRNDLLGDDWIVDVGGSVQGGDNVTLRQSVRSARRLGVEPPKVGQQGVYHRVSHEVDLLDAQSLVGRCPMASGLVTKKQIG